MGLMGLGLSTMGWPNHSGPSGHQNVIGDLQNIDKVKYDFIVNVKYLPKAGSARRLMINGDLQDK